MTTMEKARMIVMCIRHLSDDEATRHLAAHLDRVRLDAERAGVDLGIQALRELQPTQPAGMV